MVETMAVELAFSIKVMTYTNLWFLDQDFFYEPEREGVQGF